VEGQDLYDQFKLDEPWDSDHNKKLLAKMPKIYAPPGVKTKEPHTTFYQVFVGPGTVFETPRGVALGKVIDGTSNTALVAEAGEPVPWTKPDELAYAADKPLPKLGGIFSDGFHIVFCDGSVWFVQRKFNQKIMRWFISCNDGQSPGFDELNR
jgi:hypothetical protein